VNISFENKVALVTGAASGMGLATAKAFGESGASVALGDCKEEAVRFAAKELTDQGHKALAIHCDVADDAQVEHLELHEVRAWSNAQASQRSYRELLFDWRNCGRR
jgi:NAD(P)-dependent dehydrogenase (short-subunit alcohol dehydrogenase family)